jgi:hypothetical protein
MRKGKTNSEVDMGRGGVRRRKEACEKANICKECRKGKAHPTRGYQHMDMQTGNSRVNPPKNERAPKQS